MLMPEGKRPAITPERVIEVVASRPATEVVSLAGERLLFLVTHDDGSTHTIKFPDMIMPDYSLNESQAS